MFAKTKKLHPDYAAADRIAWELVGRDIDLGNPKYELLRAAAHSVKIAFLPPISQRRPLSLRPLAGFVSLLLPTRRKLT